ncbi:MAG TPA: alpha/beta fold hydrolase [Alphaproteobacteria bacterium]|nr:alpha/beta fold hydrolase [Alphaproteobacteria bacterium]
MSRSQPNKSTNVRTKSWAQRLIGLKFRLLLRFAPARAELAAARLFLTPQRKAPARSLAPVPDGAVRLAVPGRPDLAVWSWGDAAAPAVLLVHGWESEHRALGGFVAPLLAQGLRVVAFDQPAHGRSGGRTASLPEFARALRAVAVAAGGQGAPVLATIAHSLGAAATVAALGIGTRLGRVALIAPPSRPRVHADMLCAALGFDAERRRGFYRRLAGLTGVDVQGYDLTEIARGLRSPALILHARNDRVVPATHGQALAAVWPGAELALFDALGHVRILSDAGAVRRVLDFVSGAEPARRVA